MDEYDERELIEQRLGPRARRSVFELVLHLPHDVPDARRHITSALKIEGGAAVRVLDDEIGAIVGAELCGLRPAVVSLAAEQDTSGCGTQVRIRSSAVEGLGKQRAGRRAAEAVADRLRLVSGQ